MSSPLSDHSKSSPATKEKFPSDKETPTNSRPKPTRARSSGTIPGQFKFRLGAASSSSTPAQPAPIMSDGSMSRHSDHQDTRLTKILENDSRALRILELMNDFRTLQVHITSLVTRAEAEAPSEAQYYLDGYVVLRQCNAEAQAILATHYNPGSLGLEGGRIPDTEVQKATLQRIILDASTRRFQAHKIYLRSAAAMRWVQLREQASKGDLSPTKQQQALRAIDQRLREELSNINDESVVADLRTADARKPYWLDEDPSLERMLSWIRRQR